MDRLKSILVGIDFSESSNSALAQALRIAQWNDAKILVYHVVSQLEQTVFPSRPDERLAELLREHRADDGVEARSVVGSLLDSTLALCNERRADLLVVGAFGPLGPFTGDGVGVFTTQCIRHVPTKVLAVHKNMRGPFRKILACLDFSPTSEQALLQGVRLARQDQGELHALHVPVEPAAGDLRERLQATVDRVAEDPSDLNVRYIVTQPQEPRNAIIWYAREIEADVIVLGTQGRTGLRYALMGNTCERVLRSVRRSVLVTKPEGFVVPIERF